MADGQGTHARGVHGRSTIVAKSGSPLLRMLLTAMHSGQHQNTRHSMWRNPRGSNSGRYRTFGSFKRRSPQADVCSVERGKGMGCDNTSEKAIQESLMFAGRMIDCAHTPSPKTITASGRGRYTIQYDAKAHAVCMW